MNFLRKLWKDEEGQDLVEYALLVVLVSLACTAAIGSYASAISDAFGNAATNLASQS
jgi:pilus assembly protein Flp/PilA